MFLERPTTSFPAPERRIEHGGDLAAARRMFPAAPKPWIDLSTGINPHPWPCGDVSRACFERLPEPAALERLERAAATAYRLDSSQTVVAAPGAQALIQLLPRLLPGKKISVLGPTYAEHAASWRRAGCEVVSCVEPEQLAASDIAVLVNPNNPDGRIVALGTLTLLARRTQLVIDESFADFSPDMSFAAQAADAGAIVLRSFGKAYGLAGVRLGFAIGPGDFLRELRDALGPWAVSGPAIEIGIRALTDHEWRAEMGKRLASEAARLDALLVGAGFEIAGGTCLFRLAMHPRAQDWADALGNAGVHVRRFHERPDRLRFGLPPDDAWARLEAALRPDGVGA